MRGLMWARTVTQPSSHSPPPSPVVFFVFRPWGQECVCVMCVLQIPR